MNPTALLALISDLYDQLGTAVAQRDTAIVKLAKYEADAAPPEDVK